MAQLCEASTILKRLSERLYQQNNCEQQLDINSLQQILDSPLFNTLYNLQESFQELKVEFEKGNHSIKTCLFDFDIEGHLKLINDQIIKQNIENNNRLSNDNVVRKIILNKQTLNESLGFSVVAYKHRLFNINAIFIQNIQQNSLADLDGQLHIGDQLVCINDIYLDSKESTLAVRAHQLLIDSTRLSIELVVIATTTDYPHATTSTSINDGHSCVPTLSTPFHVDMVLNTLWTQIEVVELTNDGSGLGFGITGNKSTGVVVKAIVPGSIVDKDGRIHTGDHLFQINHVCVRGMSSEQVASILRQCPQQVRLVVARSIREPTSASTTTDTFKYTSPLMSQRTSLTSETLIKPTDNIDLSSATPSLSILADNDGIINSSQNKILLRTERLLESNHNFEKILENLREQCQHDDGTELLDVTLEKGDDGLGITVAGYVSPDSTNNDAIAGVFIRDIAEGSVCARDSRLAIGDQIIEVNDQSLNGFSNVQALYLLQNTSSSVRLKVRRYLDGIKYDKIKEMIALESSHQLEEKLQFQSKLNINDQITQKWIKVLGNNYDILIADVYKPDNGGLGITLEGTVDIENGEEVRPHHYIRALLRDGPIGTEGTLKSGDELLEVNNQILYGKNHIHVIEILKRVKHQIKIICSRRKIPPTNETTIPNNIHNHNRSRSISFGKTAEIVVKAKSMGTLDATNLSLNLLSSPSSIRTTQQLKSRSLEVISNLALWSTSIINIELYKTENGLGFSVLDYQDPSNPSYSPVIVIRSLVPSGVAQIDGRIVPGDRLVGVNDITLENMNLDDVIKILKSTPKGLVKLSLSKPLPYPKFKNDNEDKNTSDSDQDINNNQTNQQSSRISKSKTTTTFINNRQRSASSHRPSHSSALKQPAVSAGIALSAPAILSKHEYMESLLNQENMRKKPEQRAKSASRTNRREKPFPRFSSSERRESEKDKIRQLNTEEYLDLLPRKKSLATIRKSSANVILNLPEFKYFQSDHIVLIPQIAAYPFYDRSRGSSAFSSTKFNRQSANNNSNSNNNNNNNSNHMVSQTTTTVVSGGSPRTSYSSTKRLSRSRQTHDTTINHEQQQQQTHIMRPSSLRQMTNRFDSIGCFHEPDLSTDDDHNHNNNHNNNNNNYNVALSSSLSSSPLNHQQSIKNVTCPTTTTTTSIVDEDAHEVDAIIQQHQRLLTNNNNNENTSLITSTIKTPTTPTLTSKWTSSRQSSRMASPALSTSSQSSGRVITFLNHEVIQLPGYLEREIRVKHNFDQLGLVVDAYVDEGVNGCFIRSIASTSTIANQHGLRSGDYVLSINNESMKKISNAQARSVIRRASLIGSDISVVFIPGDEAKQFKDHTLDPQSTSSPIPPEITDSDIEPSSLKPLTATNEDSDSYGFDSHHNAQTYPTVIDSETLSATLWGSPRTVILYRNEHVKSLGISIVGGKLDFSGPGNTIESCISGIFIKHVLPDSPAGRNGTLKTGDRILEVNGYDLRDASHDRAVEIIRAAQSPVHFIVQSLLDPSNPTSSTNDNLSPNFSHIPTNSLSQNKILTVHKNSSQNERKTEDELTKQYGHLNGDLLFVDIKRNLAEINEPLGLSLIGHRDPNKLAVFVCDIQPGSLLDRDERIYPGDQLLEVNGEILLGKAHSTVTPIIKSIKADTLNFVVLRNPNAIDDMALNNQHAIAARIRASAMTPTDIYLTSTSPKLVRGQLSSSSSLQHPPEQQMTNDASHHHHVHVPKHQPDVNEYKENDDRLTTTSVFPPSMHTFDETEYIQNKNGRKCSLTQETPLPTTTTRDEKLLVAKEMPTSSLSSNRIITTTDVQIDNNDVSSLNHNISSNATITASHSIPPDVSSPTRRFILSSFNQQLNAYGNDESLPSLLPSSTTTTTSSSLLMHEQANYANDKYLENQNQMNNDILTKNNQTSTSPLHTTNEKNQNKISPTHSSSAMQSVELQQQTNNILPSDVIISSPSKQKKEDNLSPTPISPIKTTENGAVTAHIPIMSSSSSSSSSLSVSTPSSAEHSTKKQVSLSSTQVPRRASVSTPGAPITLILNKDQKGSFGLILTEHDNGIWVQSVQPHGAADQQDIRAGDQLMQINGTPVDALKFHDIQNMLEHANSNQIHLTCVPYREPQAQPVVISINQAESLPTLISNDIDVIIKEDEPRTRPIIVGQETLIEIDREQSGLGLSVVGGSDTQLSGIIIHDIYDGCAAQFDGRLLVGDQILEVNSIDLRSATHEEAIQALRQTTNVVRILVLRGKMLTEMTNEQDKFDVITIELIKKSGKGLGFSIIGRRHGYGVFISHILEGGCAEKDGRLMSGDLILEVNGQDLRTAAYEHVAYTLKTLPHGRVNIKIGRLKASARAQNRQNSVPNERKNRSRSSSSNLRRSSANKITDR